MAAPDDAAMRRAAGRDARAYEAAQHRPDIDDYIASGEWKGKAGGYAIQGRAAAFIPSIIGSYPAVVGLPVHETLALLIGLGWRPRAVL